jgi:formiminoglutamase
MEVWSGRVDAAEGRTGRRWHQVVRPVEQVDRTGIALLGFACDSGVRRNHGRPGAADGPRELRRALSNLPWHGSDDARLYDAGDIACDGDALESAQRSYAERLSMLLRAGHRPIGLGGGHEIAWGAYQALAETHDTDPRLARLGIINFDAHLDLRRPEAGGRGSSGTPFLQIAEARRAAGLAFRYLCIGVSRASNTAALFERAQSLESEIVLDVDSDAADVEQRIRQFVDASSAIYLTFCLDVLPGSVAPGVSAPAALGLDPGRAVALLRSTLAACAADDGPGKLLLADVAELNPAHDVASRTARTAARIVFEIAEFSR